MSPAASSELDIPRQVQAQVGHGIGAGLFRTVWRGRRYGAEHVPRTGPVIFAANHASFMDGPLVYGLAPRSPHIIVKSEMFHGPVGWVLTACGQIPIDRTVADRKALTIALQVLKRGDAVGIFPEGRRGRGDMSNAHAGVAWLGLTSGAPIVPVAVLGTRRTGESITGFPPPLRRVAVSFGEPLILRRPEGSSGRQALTQVTEDLRHVLAEHVLRSSSVLGIALPDDEPLEDAS